MKKKLVFTTREIVERDRILTEKETEQVLKRARERFNKGGYDYLYHACEDALFDILDQNYQGIVSAPQLLNKESDGEEMTSLSIKVEGSGYFSPNKFKDKDEV